MTCPFHGPNRGEITPCCVHRVERNETRTGGMPMRERDLTQAERFVYGECPVCKAPDGEHCSSAIGLHMGTKANGERLQDGEGVHWARLQAAPTRVREVPVR